MDNIWTKLVIIWTFVFKYTLHFGTFIKKVASHWLTATRPSQKKKNTCKTAENPKIKGKLRNKNAGNNKFCS